VRPRTGPMAASRVRCNAESRGTGNTLIALGLPGPLSNAVDVWSEYAENHVSHVAKAAGFVRFALSFDAESGRRVVEPRHYVIAFPLRDQGRQKHQSALFTLRVVREEEISRDPNAQGAVANHLRFKPPAERKLIPGADEYVEFELLSREHEMPSQQPLRISMGPVRADKQTGQKEFVRVDMGQCIQQIATDIIEDPRGGQRLVQNRWWMCIETLRLLCNVDHIDCTALDKPGVAPQEWVIRLMDTHAPINRKEEAQERPEERNIDDLMQFIDSRGPGRGCNGRGLVGAAAPQRPPRTKKKKNGREKDAASMSTTTEIHQDLLEASQDLVANYGDGDYIVGHSHAENTLIREATVERRVRGGTSADHDHNLNNVAAEASPAVSSSASSPSIVVAPASSSPRAKDEDTADTDLMGELLSRYRRLQETSGRVEIDAKVAVVREFLEVFDELERADAEMEEDSIASRVIFSATRKFEAKLRSLGMGRVEALGRPFNRALHRAIGNISEVDCGSQVIVEELESGWVLGEDLVRPALVTLG